ncbi:hypothetical protein ACFL0T_02930 [Candidatus Omnitrophota bacterium]
MNIEEPLVSVVMPCLDEEEAIGVCIDKAKKSWLQTILRVKLSLRTTVHRTDL